MIDFTPTRSLSAPPTYYAGVSIAGLQSRSEKHLDLVSVE